MKGHLYSYSYKSIGSYNCAAVALSSEDTDHQNDWPLYKKAQ